MKVCALCGEIVGVDVQTCPNDGEASWMASAPDLVLEDAAPEPKRGPGRPKKVQS